MEEACPRQPWKLVQQTPIGSGVVTDGRWFGVYDRQKHEDPGHPFAQVFMNIETAIAHHDRMIRGRGGGQSKAGNLMYVRI